MGNNSDIFKADDSSVWGTFNAHSGSAGFIIPVYQRQYDWKQDDIERLFESIVNGFSGLKQEPQSLTFLGTLILVKESNTKSKFDGTSLAIVDGQQRLTSLSLIIGQLQAKIWPLLNTFKNDTNQTTKESREWLDKETIKLLNVLFCLNLGNTPSIRSNDFYTHYPRIIRDSDYRAVGSMNSTYESNISKYLISIGKTIYEEQYNFDSSISDNNPDSSTFDKCILTINKLLSEIEQGEYLELPKIGALLKDTNYRNLFQCVDDNKKHDKMCSSLIKNDIEIVKKIVRLLSFGNYLLKNVFLVKVEVNHESESYAFDIFESLNTTGEPLTAIQTLKPKVIQHLDTPRSNYAGSLEEKCFKDIEYYLSAYRKKDRQQNESAELVISLGYYLYGEKVSKNLSIQRKFLRKHYDVLDGKEKKESIKAMWDIADYKNKFWDKSKIIESCAKLQNESDLLGFCLLFIFEMKTTMSIPILVRYYIDSIEKSDQTIFVDAVKALTAFLVLRRSITLGTDGIDTDFRNIMKKGISVKNNNGQPLRLLNQDGKKNPCLDIQILKDYFKYCLLNQERTLGKIAKKSWSARVVENGIYKVPHLCRFFLLVAAHNTEPNKKDLVLLRKCFDNPALNHMTASFWTHSDYATIEHIAPQSSVPVDGWDKGIYDTLNLNDSIGNLTLLPNFDNSTVGRKPWKVKKLYYEAFLATSSDELEDAINNARKNGCAFGAKLEKNLRDRKETRLILSSVAAADEWNKETIQKRAGNITELVWDGIAPWLGL